MSRKNYLLLAMVCELTVGCGSMQAPQPFSARVQPGADLASRVNLSSVDDRHDQADASGALPASVVKSVPPLPSEIEAPATPVSISPAVRDAVVLPTTVPALTKGQSLSQYQTVGGVVTNVSGTPIYADKVVAALTPLLSTEARQRDLNSYTLLARSEIDKQVAAMINNELEYAAATQNLGKEEKDFAENYTTQWRQRQITEAGGSVEMARRKAQADGSDFDEAVKDEYRKVFVQLFYQKKIFPKVQVTAQDMRRYYDQHLKTEFSQVEQARFRVIKISAKNMGSRAQAIDKIKQLRDQAARGDDFAKLASSINHDPALMKSAGLIGGGEGWVQHGSYTLTPVEDAVWKLQPGGVTDVVEIDNNFYIARLEDRKLGHEKPFESEEVQNAIRDKLTKQQMSVRRDQLRKKLMENSVIFPDPPQTTAVLEIALQRYPGWKGK